MTTIDRSANADAAADAAVKAKHRDPVKIAALDRDLAEVARRHDRGAGTRDCEYLLLTARKPAGAPLATRR